MNYARNRQGPRAEASELAALPLRAHTLLSGVPLHDVWRVRLEGGMDGRSLRDLLLGFERSDSARLGPTARALFGLRSLLGRLFGWDRAMPGAAECSYLARLTPQDHERSLEPPGSRRGFWTTLYTFEHEALGEVMNRTVHAFLLFAVPPGDRADTLYWAIYVRPVSRWTPLYMALIDPFRRWILYPQIIRRLELLWQEMSPAARLGRS